MKKQIFHGIFCHGADTVASWINNEDLHRGEILQRMEGRKHYIWFSHISQFLNFIPRVSKVAIWSLNYVKWSNFFLKICNFSLFELEFAEILSIFLFWLMRKCGEIQWYKKKKKGLIYLKYIFFVFSCFW